MKKKVLIIIGIIITLVVIIGIITGYKDKARIEKMEEPKYTIKITTNDGEKITYLGLGYKVVRYTAVSPYEPFPNSLRVQFRGWFMGYEFSKGDNKIAEGEKSFFGKVIESNASYIIVEPNENEEERKSSDKILIGLGENNDALYMVGTNVKITYDGTILESYPAQIKASKIEINSADSFEIVFKDRQTNDSYNKVYAILDKSETDKYDYSIYAYMGSVNIIIDGTEYPLKDALIEGKITMNEIIAKANKDITNALVYRDGGSKEYHYDDYTIIKCHRVDGNRDVYIGTKDMTINDLVLF